MNDAQEHSCEAPPRLTSDAFSKWGFTYTHDTRPLRKHDLVPLWPPDGWVDPYPNDGLDSVVGCMQTNPRVILSAVYRGVLRPGPFLLRVESKEVLFVPCEDSPWETVYGPLGALTKLRAVHYRAMSPANSIIQPPKNHEPKDKL